MAWKGDARLGWAGLACPVLVGPGVAGRARSDEVGLGLAGLGWRGAGVARLGLARLAWCGTAGQGQVRRGW